MRDYTKALEVIQEATEHDDEAKHTTEIQQQMIKCQNAIMQQRAGETDEEALQRAMRDPEVAVRSNKSQLISRSRSFLASCDQGIMNDPVMQSILQQAQGNPGALQDHMKNPTVREKIMKLINAGIIKTR